MVRLLVALWAAGFCAGVRAECAPAEILVPPPDSTLRDPRPEIKWRALPGVSVYRVQIESRVPEGQVIERVDARVSDTRFVPPRALADRRAAVKLLVAADCAEPPSIATRPAWFFIDAAANCPAVQGLAFSGANPPTAAWSRSSGATRYEVEAYSAAADRLVARKDTTGIFAELPRVDSSLIVAVRPRCDAVSGEAAYGLLPASR